jgi:hypothetical protein
VALEELNFWFMQIYEEYLKKIMGFNIFEEVASGVSTLVALEE